MSSTRFIEHARWSFTFLRYSPVVAALLLPLTFSDGAIGAKLIGTAALTAFIWIFSIIIAWRSRNQLWFVLSFAVMMILPRFLAFNDPEVTSSRSFQWLCYFMIFAGCPLLLQPQRIRKAARLIETNEKTEQGADGDADETV